MTSRLRIGVLCDPREENWPSMDLVGEMLLAEWKTTLAQEVDATEIDVSIPRLARHLPGLGKGIAFNADRLAARFVSYPARALAERRRQDFFHVVDHSYAQLVHALPGARTGVFCHDVDAFRSLILPALEQRPAWFRAMARVTLRGLRAAAVVFHSTLAVRRQLIEYRLVRPMRLVHAPYGVSAEFTVRPHPDDRSGDVLLPLHGSPFLLHVGSAIARKRIDVLFEVFARLRARSPDLWLVQQGGELSSLQRAHADRLGIASALIQPRKLNRATLAGLYRRARILMMPSDAEGFGFPIVEGLACGASIVASEIDVLKEVGGEAVTYAPVGDVDAWTAIVDGLLRGDALAPSMDLRIAQAARFTWAKHARVIFEAYAAMNHPRSS